MTSFPAYIYFIVISFIASISIFYKNKHSQLYLKLFSAFLFISLVIELLGYYRRSMGQNNLALYNFFTTFEFCFYCYIISMIVQNKKFKKRIGVSVIVYALFAITNIFLIQKMGTFHTISYSIGCLLVVYCCVYYFFELFQLNQTIKLKNNPAFWICSGLLFFYCCSFPLYGLINFWDDISKLVVRNFGNIASILNIFLYSLFTIAFLCIRTPKYTSSQS